MGLNYYASSPTVVLPPQQPPSYPFEQRFNAQHPPTHATFGSSSKPRRAPKYPTPPSLNYQAAPSHAVAGRKRSLDDVDSEAAADGSKIITKPKPEPIMGPGMTLIYPGEPGFTLAAESQTGTWAEVRHEVEEANKPAERPIAVSRKSQRTDSIINAASISRQVNQDGYCQLRTVFSRLQGDHYAHRRRRPHHPRLTMALGIGWKEIVFNPAKAPRRKGLGKIHQQDYPLSCPQVLHESEAHDAYLVFARDETDELEKFFLFSQGLALLPPSSALR
ncbi:hypothetical protein IWZ00DRAFT_55488 [Phyllosticta capitalensis]